MFLHSWEPQIIKSTVQHWLNVVEQVHRLIR